jgi:hypothetical protein
LYCSPNTIMIKLRTVMVTHVASIVKNRETCRKKALGRRERESQYKSRSKEKTCGGKREALYV